MKQIHPAHALDNTTAIAKMCNLEVGEGDYYLPSYEVENSESLENHLKKTALEKLQIYFKNNPDLDQKLYTERLGKELR